MGNEHGGRHSILVIPNLIFLHGTMMRVLGWTACQVSGGGLFLAFVASKLPPRSVFAAVVYNLNIR